MFQSSMFLDDITLNNSKRSDSNATNTTSSDPNVSTMQSASNRGYPSNLQIAQNQFSENPTHISGTPYSENQNKLNLTKAPSLRNNQPTTFGEAFANNLVNDLVTKAEMAPIFGVSANQISTAIESGNAIALADLLKTAATTLTNSFVQPSSLLNGQISNGLFMNFLNGIVQSEATNGKSQLTSLARTIIGSSDLLNRPIDNPNAEKNEINKETHGKF